MCIRDRGYTQALKSGEKGVWTTQNPLNDGMRSKCNSMNPNKVLKPDDDLPRAPGSDDAIIAKYLGTKVLEGAMGRIVNIEENEYSIVFAKTKENKTTTKSLGLDIFLVCLLYTSPSPRDVEESRMPSSA